MTVCAFVPPYLLERVASLHGDDDVGACCRGTLAIDADIRARRAALGPASAPGGESSFAIHDAGGTTTLPGRLVRSAGEPPVGDAAVDEAHHGVDASLRLLREAFGRTSYDGRGAHVVATTHYGRSYDNAFWDGRQLVFGDGDGRVFGRFTKAVDVLGHELAHAVTEHTAGLEYSDESGALNESFSDVFAACLKQRELGQSAVEADWLIGEGIFMPSVRGRALRSMAAPGTAYDDPVLGRDPQVGHMSDYVRTTEDNGGVHLNSGIPNKAFQLAAVTVGGASWDVTGRIWFAALTSGIRPRASFAELAAATVAAAESFGGVTRSAVAEAWDVVGVAPDAGHPGRPATDDRSGAPPRPEVVTVIRSGGFAGIRRSGELRLGDDPRGTEVERLLAGVDLQRLAGVRSSRHVPDAFVYDICVDGEHVVLGEQDLTPELLRVTELVLDDTR